MQSQSAKNRSSKAGSPSDQAIWSACMLRIFFIPCITLSTITLHPNDVQAQSLFERRFQQRLEQRIEKRRREEAKLTDNQKQQLFLTRRSWIMSTYDERLALLESTRSCLQRSKNFVEGEKCRSTQLQAWRELLQQRLQVINTERQRLSLAPLRSVLLFGF
ncbi:MAG: hypothetical protein CMN91_09305 [Synechococcus sp. ARS1019]|nr:hypothetical protein [Synechococcus sp. ARS1019]|tara:strand:- start:296 stop:778 length:483 start_codon:yes stop_codon:yes gene_type:complete